MSAIVPEPIGRQPWQVILPLLLLVSFGAAVLDSAAGGSMEPYADPHLVRFAVFMVVAIVVTFLPQSFIKFISIPFTRSFSCC
jgi:rod shape determining protein RodA